MKKFTKLAMVFTAMAIGSTAFAQKQCNLGLTITASPTTINYGDTTRVTVKITNSGPAAMGPTDTIYYSQVGSSTVFSLIPSASIPMGGSETFPNELYYRHSTDTLTADRVLNFCFKLLPQSAITIDPDGNGPLPSRPAVITYVDPVSSNDSTCTTVTLKKKPVGIFEFGDISKESLTVFPNPAMDKVSFELNLTKAENIQVSVKDITGREVMRKDFGKINAGNSTSLSLDVSRLRAGMYIVEMNGEERKAVGRFNKR